MSHLHVWGPMKRSRPKDLEEEAVQSRLDSMQCRVDKYLHWTYRCNVLHERPDPAVISQRLHWLQRFCAAMHEVTCNQGEGDTLYGNFQSPTPMLAREFAGLNNWIQIQPGPFTDE